ncbi:FAD-dependent oxidoreductase [Brachybacterium sp. GCM10030267]|uniref:FAD-dependent oxidoreductase n=1 Tax=unclassified Brachybacterium TaxID=2623841 RepID=UPI0036108033
MIAPGSFDDAAPGAAEPDGPPPDCDVLIVGGGPTGLFLAALLVRRGVSVLVLECRTAPSTHSRAIGLHPPALSALREVGLDDAAIAAGVRLRGGSARGRRGELGRLRFEGAWPHRPFVLSLPQSRTEELLEGRLAEFAPGTLQRGWEVTGLREIGDRIEVTARHTAPGDAGAPVVHRRARMLVGADGSHSRVRELLGVPTTRTTYPDTYLMGDAADPDGDGEDREGFIHLDPDGVVESFPLPGGLRRWVVHTGSAHAGAHSGRYRSADPSPAALAEIVRSRTKVRIDTTAIRMISAFTVHRRTARHLLTGRCMLIGDAAHEISPIGGQGISLGWLDAYDLAPLIPQTVTSKFSGTLRGSREWLQFEKTCQRRARTARLLAHLNMALGRPLAEPLSSLRGLAVRAALHSPVRRVMARAYSMAWVRTR